MSEGLNLPTAWPGRSGGCRACLSVSLFVKPGSPMCGRTNAPPDFVEVMLGAIVGAELAVPSQRASGKLARIARRRVGKA
jgi:hypothetical protein